MKKKLAAILAAAIFSSANFTSAEDVEIDGAANAPAEINHPDSIYYPDLDFYNMTSRGDRIILPHFGTYQQTTEYTCGPSASLMVLRYYGNYDFDEMELAKEMKTQGYPIGTNPANMVKFFQKIGWEVESSVSKGAVQFKKFGEFREFVLKNLELGRPIIVENIEWGGHWRVIIGYDGIGTDVTQDDVLIFAEPYDTTDHEHDGYSFGSARRFYSMWFDHSMLPKKQRNQPWIVAYPKE